MPIEQQAKVLPVAARSSPLGARSDRHQVVLQRSMPGGVDGYRVTSYGTEYLVPYE